MTAMEKDLGKEMGKDMEDLWRTNSGNSESANKPQAKDFYKTIE